MYTQLLNATFDAKLCWSVLKKTSKIGYQKLVTISYLSCPSKIFLADLFPSIIFINFTRSSLLDTPSSVSSTWASMSSRIEPSTADCANLSLYCAIFIFCSSWVTCRGTCTCILEPNNNERHCIRCWRAELYSKKHNYMEYTGVTKRKSSWPKDCVVQTVDRTNLASRNLKIQATIIL